MSDSSRESRAVHYRPTPQLSDHARERCAEMGVVTKRVKRIVQDPDVRLVARESRVMCYRDDDPDIAVVVTADFTLVVTVLWRTIHEYERAGTTWTRVS